MSTNVNKLNSNRREFLKKTIIAGTFLGFGCHKLMAASKKEIKNLVDSGMTVEEVIRFAYGNSIPIFQSLAKELGKEKLLKLLEKASAEKMVQGIEFMAKDLPNRDMAQFTQLIKNYLSTPPYDTTLENQITEESETVLEVKYTECLFAKIFREMDASDIGYALECSASDAAAKTFNPKMKVTNPKNLMKGDSYCIERFTLKA